MKENKTFNIGRTILVFVVTFFIVSILFFLSHALFGLNFLKVSGNSMYPNLVNGERIMTSNPVWDKDKNIHRGSVIVFNATGVDPRSQINNNLPLNDDSPDYYIKRVIGMPGDTVSFRNDNLYVNNHLVQSNIKYISNKQATLGTRGPQGQNNWNLESLSKSDNPISKWNSFSIKDLKDNKVPQNMYFVMGDNRAISNDSRYYGFVPKNKILGHVYVLNGHNRQIVQNVQLK